MSNLGEKWREYLLDIYLNGKVHVKDDGDKIKEILGVHLYLHKPQSLSFYNKLLDVDLNKFLSGLKEGVYDIEGYSLRGNALFEYVNAWNNPDQIYLGEHAFIYTYPERIFNINVVDRDADYPVRMNQFNVMLQRLQKHQGSNRAVATLYNVGLDRMQQHIPCLNFIQAIIRENKLTLFCMFRSNDIFNAWPSNMLLLTHLGLKIAAELDGVEFEGIDYHCSSAHYYITEEPLIEKLLG